MSWITQFPDYSPLRPPTNAIASSSGCYAQHRVGEEKSIDVSTKLDNHINMVILKKFATLSKTLNCATGTERHSTPMTLREHYPSSGLVARGEQGLAFDLLMSQSGHHETWNGACNRSRHVIQNYSVRRRE
ncbi:hypothetical protein [Burkholderia cepacia]|uniref:hypothetical protein n=1 Tax=Burkholderia cepacia TaxID=292 RepID=UPI0012D8B5B3|nr:hypothetical protein [Burkholderia cepacia]